MGIARRRKQRLLFVRKASSFGGADVLMLDLLKGINYDAHSVVLASSFDHFSDLLRQMELPVAFLPIAASFDGGFVHVVVSWTRFLRRFRPDKIVLVEGGFREFALGPALAAFAAAKGNVWLMELHPAPASTEAYSAARRRMLPLNMRERLRISCAQGVLSVSHGVKERLVRVYGYAPEKVHVVHHGVDTRFFTPASEKHRTRVRQDLGVPADATVLVSTARLVATKCLECAIQAFGVISRKHSNLLLFLTGEGPERDKLERLTRCVPNGEHIKFLGNVPDVNRVLQASDVYVLPSNEEGFGIALVEAMACQLLCVATNTIGAVEIIEDGVDGFLTDASYDGVLNGLERALSLSQKERDRLGRRAREKVVANFRIEDAVAKALGVLEIKASMPNGNQRWSTVQANPVVDIEGAS